jgi:hypothetical protein
LTLADVAQLVDSNTVVTCSDVHAITSRRLSEVIQSRDAGTPEAAALTQLLKACAGTGSRKNCKILQMLAREDAAKTTIQARRRSRPRRQAPRADRPRRAAPSPS